MKKTLIDRYEELVPGTKKRLNESDKQRRKELEDELTHLHRLSLEKATTEMSTSFTKELLEESGLKHTTPDMTANNKEMTTLDEKIKELVTYHSDDGTSGYLLSDKQISQLKSLILSELKRIKPEELENTKEESDTEYFYGVGNNHALAEYEQAIEEVLK